MLDLQRLQKFNTHAAAKYGSSGRTHMLVDIVDLGDVARGIRGPESYVIRKLMLGLVWKQGHRADDGTPRLVNTLESKWIDAAVYEGRRPGEESDLWKILIATGIAKEDLSGMSKIHWTKEGRDELAAVVINHLRTYLYQYFLVRFDYNSASKRVTTIDLIGPEVPATLSRFAITRQEFELDCAHGRYRYPQKTVSMLRAAGHNPGIFFTPSQDTNFRRAAL